MAYDNNLLNRLYDKTGGRCHLCRGLLAFRNYGQFGSRGSWEVDHSNARARGGSNHQRNLLPACITCNRSKQHRTTRSVRRLFGHSRAPLSREARERRTDVNILAGLGAGALVGAALGGFSCSLCLHHCGRSARFDFGGRLSWTLRPMPPTTSGRVRVSRRVASLAK